MSLYIHKSGILDTIQDAGRYGYQHLGINPGGVMDAMAMQVANILVGNSIEEAVLEMHFPAAEIVFEDNVLIALSGADLSASIDGTEVPILHPVWIRKGTTLRFGKQREGARIYLAIQGGYQANQWLHSYSTHLKVKAGGFEGRALQKNDRLFFKVNHDSFIPAGKNFLILPWQANVSELYTNNTFQFVRGAEYEWLTIPSKQQLEKNSFLISRQSDRMGYRLEGEILHATGKELISTAVTRGTIQLLPDGQLIILMADHQTTGGYPRVGHLISADMPSLAQMNSGQSFTLQQATIEMAETKWMQQQSNLRQLQNACNFRLQEYVY